MVSAAPASKATTSKRDFIVHAHRDEETGGWWAESDDIPGLVTEAATFAALVQRVNAVAPEICEANGIFLEGGDILHIRRKSRWPTMTRVELERALSELGASMWAALLADDTVLDAINGLAERKLANDGVSEQDSILDEGAALAIFDDVDTNSPNVTRPKEFVPTKEWAKNSLYNLALRWVLSQALARMQSEQKFASEVERNGG